MSDVRIPDGKISRRRVVQGAMWTAPAVLIATALPAAAGSLVNGTMVFKTGYTLVRSGPGTDRHYLFSNFILTHTGGAPITGLTITIAVDTGNATLVRPPTITGGNWTLVSGTSATSFTFQYVGTLSAGDSLPLTVDFVRIESSANIVTFTVTALGNTGAGTNNVSATASSPIPSA